MYSSYQGHLVYLVLNVSNKPLTFFFLTKERKIADFNRIVTFFVNIEEFMKCTLSIFKIKL